MEDIDRFIARWADSGGAERANYGMFLTELCDLIGVPRPEPARDDERTDYRFEYPVTFRNADGSTSAGRIDLYKRDCFVLEAKQSTNARLAQQLPLFGEASGIAGAKGATVRGTDRWAMAMQAARAQAEGYAKALPTRTAGRRSWSWSTSGTRSSCSPTSRGRARTTASSRTRTASASASMICAAKTRATCCGVFGPSRWRSTRAGAARR
jgi:hypothetical protein